MRVNLEARAKAAERRRSETRSRLILAALEVIARHGPDGPVFDQVAEAAGLSRATVYNYFPTPDDLLKAVIQHFSTANKAEIDLVLQDIADPARAFAEWCAYFVSKAADDPTWAWLFLHLGASGLAPSPRPGERFMGLVRQGVETGRFRPCDLDAMGSLFHGSFRLAMRRVVMHEAPATHVLDVAELILVALGLEPDEAHEIGAATARAHGLRG